MTTAVAQIRGMLRRFGRDDLVTAVDGLVEENAQLRRAFADALATIEAADVGECPVCGGEEPCVGECFEPELAMAEFETIFCGACREEIPAADRCSRCGKDPTIGGYILHERLSPPPGAVNIDAHVTRAGDDDDIPF